MIKKYEKYLQMIGLSLDKFFAEQKPYIFCKEGCSICCETGSYPLSKVEFDYIMQGYEALSDDLKAKINKNIEGIKANKIKSEEKQFMHACPFLIDSKCSVYSHRALICRSYGLMCYYEDEEGNQRYKMPCCVDMGLNYSNVYDAELKTITTKKWLESGIEVEPVSHNVDLSFLRNNPTTKDLNLEFGQFKGIIDWFD